MDDAEVNAAALPDDLTPAPEPQPGLGLAIRSLRESRGWGQHQLAARSGVTLGTVSDIERGQRDPKWSTVRRLCRDLEVTLGELAVWAIRLDPDEFDNERAERALTGRQRAR
jgi:transcriptional regulator with XRE-family HTH domain